jgi:multidrug efflux pump subunit AcrA (membrane-fusion protein)
MKSNPVLILMALGLLMIHSCKSKHAEQPAELIAPKAAVSVTKPVYGSIENRLTLNGKTVLYKKNQEPAPISGYITAVHIQFGDNVEAGQVLFEIETPENRALEKSDTKNASIGTFGKIKVRATTPGVVSEPLLHGKGAYVSEGNVLCTIADLKDLVVRVNVPFEYHDIIHQGIQCRLLLPDQTAHAGTVIRVRPFMEESSQTQEVLVKPSGNQTWPENMNLTVSFQKDNRTEALLLPKRALLTNETQDEFWVMKVMKDSLAVKIPVEPGIMNDSLVEIISNGLGTNDNIILEGGYGLEDSSLVTILR